MCNDKLLPHVPGKSKGPTPRNTPACPSKSRSKEPTRNKQSQAAEGSSSGVSLLAPPRQLIQDIQLPPVPAPGADPVARFFEGTKKNLSPPPRTDAQASTIDKVIIAKLDKPLTFNADEDTDSGDSLDMGPALSLARHTPQAADTHAVQLGEVTQKVTEMQRQGGDEDAVLQPLFTPLPQVVIGKPPARDKTPLKTRAAPKPAWQSTRQANNPSMVPVSQRATLRQVHGLGILGPKEKMTAQAAEALIRRFNKPLTDSDIAAIAKLTRLDARALKAIAGANGQEGEASGRSVTPC